MTMHPLKLTTSEMSYTNSKIKLKTMVFTDDLEMILREDCNNPTIDLINKGYDKITLQCIKKHWSINFKLWKNNKEISLKLKSAQLKPTNNEVTIVEFESDKVIFNKKDLLKLQNTIFFKNIPEQKNVVNYNLNGQETLNETLIFENEKEETIKNINW